MRVEGVRMDPPSKIMLRWAFWIIFSKIGENSKLSAWIFPDFCAVQLTTKWGGL